MSATQADFHAAPLAWGHGPVLFEMFLEPTCPHSVRALGKRAGLLHAAGEDRVTVRLWIQSQPWHMFSGVVTRCVLAASGGASGREAALAVLEAVAAHREEYEFERHCSGANMDATPREIVARLEAHSGVALADAFTHPGVEAVIKRHAKFARQNGIHVSPTFMIDGLVQPDMGSRDEVSSWVAKLGG